MDKKFLVILDNGHGKNTPGKRSIKWDDGTQLFEWEWCREIAKLLKERLDAENIPCVLLVPGDDDVELSTRANAANNIKGYDAKIMISIHGNASTNGGVAGKARGWEIYTTKATNNSDILAQKFVDNFKYVFDGTPALKDIKKVDRGQKESNFTILFKTNCPCVLTENFFYDNEEDCKFMLSEEGKDKIVELHYRAIKEYLASLS